MLKMKILVTSEMVAPSRGFGVTERFFWHHSNSSDQQANIVNITQMEREMNIFDEKYD